MGVYKNQAYGTTYEPAVFIYNKRLVTGDDPDRSRVVRYFIARRSTSSGQGHDVRHRKSGVGFMFMVQDAKFFPGMKDLEHGFGASTIASTAAPATCSKKSRRASTC